MSTYQRVLQQISTEVTSYVLKKCLMGEKTFTRSSENITDWDIFII